MFILRLLSSPRFQGIALALIALFSFDWYQKTQAENSLQRMEERIGRIQAKGELTTASQPVTTTLKKEYPAINIAGISIPATDARLEQQVTFTVSAGVDLSKIQRLIDRDQVIIKLPPVHITSTEQDYNNSQVRVEKGILSPSNPTSDLYPLLQKEKERISKESCERMSDQAIQGATRVIGLVMGDIPTKIEPSPEQCVVNQ